MEILARYGRRMVPLITATATLLLAACSTESPVGAAPQLPGNPAIPQQYRGAAFIMDVNAGKRSVKITAPTSTIRNPSANMIADGRFVGSDVNASLLGGDVVELTASNFVAGAVGAAVPGKVLITFDLTVNNRLPGIQLATPTFPTPPAGVSGVQLFPFEISVTTTSGGVVGNGNEVIVESPRFGAVVPSNDWSGEPHNFFNDVGCTGTSNDCFRYEPFGAIAPLGASTTQNVGFLIDPTVGDFRVKMIVAGDLIATTTPNPGTISGTVTSPQLGALNNVTVNVSGGFSGTTAGAGAYSIANVATGSRTVSVANLPSGCTAPSSQSVTVAPSGTHTVNFTVTCTVPTGGISGAITSSLGGGLAGVQVTVTPTGASALPSATSAATTGAYSVASVPSVPATGNITLANLPAGCTNPGATPYSGMTTGGLTVNITVTCAAAPVTYPFSATWGAITNTGPTGRQVTLTFAINMGGAPGRLDVDGANADPLAGISFSVGYNGLGLDYISRSLLSPDEFDLGALNESGQGTTGASTSAAIGSTSGGTKTGAFDIVRLTFNIATGFSGTITPTVNVSQALATSTLINVTSSVVVQTIPSLIIP
jgi:hypothetical protein